jgi:hypothetical protein
MSDQPDALQIAEWPDRFFIGTVPSHYFSACAAELRRQHAEIERLRDELRQSSIDHTRAEIEALRAERDALRAELDRLTTLRPLSAWDSTRDGHDVSWWYRRNDGALYDRDHCFENCEGWTPKPKPKEDKT